MAKDEEGKPNFIGIPIGPVLAAIARAKRVGDEKYGPDSWRTEPAEVWARAAARHMAAWIEDPLVSDRESGLNHIDHIFINLAFYLDARLDHRIEANLMPPTAAIPVRCGVR